MLCQREGLTPICTDDTDLRIGVVWVAVVWVRLVAGWGWAEQLDEAVGLFFGEVFFFVVLFFIFFAGEVVEVFGVEGGAGWARSRPSGDGSMARTVLAA